MVEFQTNMGKVARLILAVATSLTLCSQVLAQKSPPPHNPISVAEILNKHIAATGGLEALHGLQTLTAHGKFGLAPMGTRSMGDFDFSYKALASDIFQLDLISHGEVWVGHKEGAAFANHSGENILAFNGVTLSVWEQAWLSLIESEFGGRYKRIELVGFAGVDGRWTYALRFTPQLGDPLVRYYDCETFLMVRMDLVQRIRLQKDGPEQAYIVQTYYSNYRNFGGLNLPRQIKATVSVGDFVLDVYDIRTNIAVSDSVFLKN